MGFDAPHVNELGYGSLYGSTTRKVLQNEALSDLDLLVREAVQNSSDASLSYEGKAASHVCVDFQIHDFEPKKLNAEMTGITRVLNERFSGRKALCLEIRDSKTIGLTGPIRLADVDGRDHGNYFKLVFDTGKKQEQQGAGGNWGFGKSVYYRVGDAGIVIFYSRIKLAEGAFEERLIGTLVEDETDIEASILSALTSKSVGRAWWGVRDSNNEILPVRDHAEIERFLSIFGVEPFSGSKTGTSVLIPYINESRLLARVLPEMADDFDQDEKDSFIWAESLSEYLKYALWKWYAPRLGNRDLPSLAEGAKWIKATVGNDILVREEMPPFFQLVQNLYNTALSEIYKKDYDAALPYEIEKKVVRVNNEGLVSNNVGCVAFVRIKNVDLNGGEPSLSPYVLSGNFNNSPDVNEPITMFAREPGMVIDYSITSEWSARVTPPVRAKGLPEDEFIISFLI